MSEFRRNRNDTVDYSMMTLQTPEGEQQALVYSPNKRKVLLSNQTSSTPVKIQKFSTTSDGKKIIVNDMFIISSPYANEYSFQYNETTGPHAVTVNPIVDSFQKFKEVSVKGKVIGLGQPSVVGKGLKLCTRFLRDESGTIPLHIWENYLPQIEDGAVYSLSPVIMRCWDGVKKYRPSEPALW